MSPLLWIAAIPLVCLPFASITAADKQQRDTFTLHGQIQAARLSTASEENGGVVLTVEVIDQKGRTYLLLVTPSARLEMEVGNKLRVARAVEFKRGQTIEAVCGSEVTASDPPQAAAVSILIKSSAK